MAPRLYHRKSSVDVEPPPDWMEILRFLDFSNWVWANKNGEEEPRTRTRRFFTGEANERNHKSETEAEAEQLSEIRLRPLA